MIADSLCKTTTGPSLESTCSRITGAKQPLTCRPRAYGSLRCQTKMLHLGDRHVGRDSLPRSQGRQLSVPGGPREARGQAWALCLPCRPQLPS